MVKKIIFATSLILVVCLIAHQSAFLYAMNTGQFDIFRDTWRDFGVTQTEYSIFVFKHAKFLWGVPIICSSVAIAALVVRKNILLILAVILTVICDVALLWSIYGQEPIM